VLDAIVGLEHAKTRIVSLPCGGGIVELSRGIETAAVMDDEQPSA
jgi:hypothetical protein